MTEARIERLEKKTHRTSVIGRPVHGIQEGTASERLIKICAVGTNTHKLVAEIAGESLNSKGGGDVIDYRNP